MEFIRTSGLTHESGLRWKVTSICSGSRDKYIHFSVPPAFIMPPLRILSTTFCLFPETRNSLILWTTFATLGPCVCSFILVFGHRYCPLLERGIALYIEFRVTISINSALRAPLLILATMQVSHMAALWLGKDNPCVFHASFLVGSISVVFSLLTVLSSSIWLHSHF